MWKIIELYNQRKRLENVVHCCGIVGYCGTADARGILLDGIKLLENRGYDSCGITTISNDKKLCTTKFASKGTTSDCVDLLRQQVNQQSRAELHHMGIAHTRWATHGGKTDENAHPHMDYKERISVVHNGTIDNFDELKKELIEKYKIPFRSQTDTEVIANLIGLNLDRGSSFQEAVKATVKRLRGTWGLLVMHKDDANGFMCARNGSPLILGTAAGEVYVASEPRALAQYTNEYLSLNDGDVCYVDRGSGISNLETGRDKRSIEPEVVALEPTPFRHWTIREIYEQPRSIARALSFGGRVATMNGNRTVKLGGLDANREDILKTKHLLITGCGTSLYAGIYGEALFRFLNAVDTVVTVDSSDVEPSYFPTPASDHGVLALSQSGETRDVVQALEAAELAGVRKLSVVNQVGSQIARMTGCGVYLHAGREVAVASTKAFTNQVMILALMAVWFTQNKNYTKKQSSVKQLLDSLARMPSVASSLLGLEDECRELASRLAGSKSLFVLGKGFGYPVALEGALKIKEISYVHAEGFGGSQLKHGPFALIDRDEQTPVIMLIFDDQHASAMANAAQQVKARGARLICITDDPKLVPDCADHVLEVPRNGCLTALGAVIPLQLIAYYMAVHNGINPDKPRGLAKTVTVA